MFRTLRCTTWILVGLGPALAQAPTQHPESRQILWQRSLEDALAIAKAEDRPLLVAVNMDGESASDRIVHERYRDPEFVAATRSCVCLAASVFRHNRRDYDDQGRRIPCPRLGEVTCGEHMALEPVLYQKYLADGDRVAPRHALILQNGEKAWDVSLSFDLRDIDRALLAFVQAETARRAELGLVDAERNGTGWPVLAARRDHRGRQALEAEVTRTHAPSGTVAALEALASHGDAGSLDALRLVGGRIPATTATVRRSLVITARALRLEAELAAVLRRQLQVPGPPPGLLGSERDAVLLPVLSELDGADLATRSRLLAWRALFANDRVGAAVQRAFGAEASRAIDAVVRERGGEFSLRSLMQVATAISTRLNGTPRPDPFTVALPELADLLEQMDRLDAEMQQRQGDPELYAKFAKASLDLGRRRLEAQQGGALLLFEDAEAYFKRALDQRPDRVEWWIERARAASYRQRFADQLEYGRRAVAIASAAPPGQLPSESVIALDPTAAAVLDDARVIEALRWIGDGNARLLGERAGQDPAAEIGGILEGIRAFALVAASPYGDATDWNSLASVCGAVGLARVELAAAKAAALRLPASRECRQMLNGALWNAGRIDLAPEMADRIAAWSSPSADAQWFSGYARVLAAENQRRCEDMAAAIVIYDAAAECFDRAAAMQPDYRDNCNYFIALTWLGRGLAHVRDGRRAVAADCLVAALAMHRNLTEARDGLGYDVLDLIDKILEWREIGASPVDPLGLLDRLEEAAPNTTFWALAVSDSELREGLRADGRNPKRVERDTVDAEGKPIRMLMGLPTVAGDEFLRAAIAAGRRAIHGNATEDERKPLAQALTIWAERGLQIDRLEGVQASLAEAAPLLGLPAPAADVGVEELRALAAKLRAILGEARPRFRPGR